MTIKEVVIIIMDYTNIKEFCDRYNRIVNSGEYSSSTDKQFLYYWKTELAMAIMRDLKDEELVDTIAKTMLFINQQC